MELNGGRELRREIPRVFPFTLSVWDSLQVNTETFTPPPQVFHTFVVSFSEQRRPIIPLLTAMRRSPKLSEEQRALREAWDTLTEKVSTETPQHL